MEEEENDEVLFDLDKLFEEKNEQNKQNSLSHVYSLRYLISEPFSWYLYPNNILTKPPLKEKSHMNLNKFKESNTGKVMEDMLYYCAPVEILEKIDAQNKTNSLYESEMEFMDDLGIVCFFQNENVITKRMKDEYKVSQIIKNNNLKDWKEKFLNKKDEKESVNKINKFLLLIFEVMKIFINKTIDKDEVLKKLDPIISFINLEKIEFEMQDSIVNNILYIFEVINKYFEKEEDKCTFLEKFIQLINITKSSRLFFGIIEYLKKNKNSLKINNIEYKFDMFYNKCIDISEIIKSLENQPLFENILNLPNLSDKSNSEIEKEKSLNKNDFFALNNSEELFLFKLSKINQKIKIFFYRINLRSQEDSINYENDKTETDGDYRLIDFGDIILCNDEKDQIFDINISIKNDIIYICYFVNQKLKNQEQKSEENEFRFHYKLFTTSMILLKENSFKLDDLNNQNSLLFSDKDNIYIYSSETKLFVMKKEYLMNSFEIHELSINCKKEGISINNYKYYNNFNLENLLILENKNDINDLLLVQINREDNKYILNLFPIKPNSPDNNQRYKITYNENVFIIIKLNDNKVYFSFTKVEVDNFAEIGFQFLPFNTNLIKDAYNKNRNDDIYKRMIKDYSYFVNLYGNFDLYEFKKINLTQFPFSLCFNINQNNLNFINDQILLEEDNEMNYYYIIIFKQFICSLYNTNLFDINMASKVFEYFKKIIMNSKNNKSDKYQNKILKEITYISSYLNDYNIIEIEEVEKIMKEGENDYKINLLLMDLLLTQPKTQINSKVFEIVCEYDKKFLQFIFSNKIDVKTENKIISSLFKLYKRVMSKAMCLMNNYFLNNDIELFKYIQKIAENVVYICNLYKTIRETNIGRMPFLFNSVNFLFFFLIIQRRTMNKTFNKDFKIFSSLYNTLIALDELEINKNKKKALDLDNILEITNSKLESDAKEENEKKEKCFNEIKFKTKQNITFKSNFINYVGKINLHSYFDKIILITKNNDIETKNEIDINHCLDEIFYDVEGLEIYFKEKIKFKWRAVINIIPIKDLKEYLEFKNNENFKIINQIQKTLLNYFLFLMKNVDNEMNEFLKNDNVKKFCKLYNNEFLQFIYTNDIELDKNLNEIKNELKSEDKEKEDENIVTVIDNFKEELKYSLDLVELKKDDSKDNKTIEDSNLIMELLKEFKTFFGDFNLNNSKNFLKLDSYYNKNDITLNQIKSYKEINLENDAYKKLFEQFDKDIAKKNKLLNSLSTNESLKKIIFLIFKIIIKYYNYNAELSTLIETVNFSSQNEKYNLFLDIYEKCCQMKMVYNQEKNRFVDEKFQEQSEQYFKVTFAKLDFLYQIIIPSFNEKLKYDKSIVQNLIELIKSESFNPKELLKYSEIQNIICTLKQIELLIINNLLLNLNDEENIKFILHIINDIYNKNKENNDYSINISLLDSIYGADYSQMQEVKNYFHLLIGIIVEKYILNKSNYDNLGISTKILLYQSLLWKYKGRDFNILPKILSCFEDLKNAELDKSKIIFDLGNEKVYRINNYNLGKFNDIKYEIFKIVSSQIFSKIKENLENNNTTKEINVVMKLQRTLSNIINSDSILNLLMSYFWAIEKNNKFYHDIILYFYKNIINSHKLIKILNTSRFSDIIVKILSIIFEDDSNNIDNKVDKKRNNYTKLIILKLFLQILQNIDNEDKIMNLSECCMEYDKDAFKENEEESNPFVYLASKLNSKLNCEEYFLKHYYIKVLLFCLDKIDKSELIPKENKLLDINFLISLNENFGQIESKLYIKSNLGDVFEEIALFLNNDNTKMGKTGTLLCYMEDNRLFNEFIFNYAVTYFNYNDFIYNIQQIKNCENIILIMDDKLNEEVFTKINNLDIRSKKDLIIIPDEKNNILINKYFEKNAKYIYKQLISKLTENKLNYKGINYILKLIYNILDYISIENADSLCNYIFDFLDNKEVEMNQKEWDFCSYEYFENEMSSYRNIFYSADFDINKEIKKEKEKKEISNVKDKLNEAPLLLTSLFNFSLKNDNDFYIEYKSYNNINTTFSNQLTLVNKELCKEEHKANKEIKVTNLSFYKADSINDSTLITNDSLLLLRELTIDDDLLKILSENCEKIKAIIISKNDDSKGEEYNQYLNKIKIPIYLVSINFYNKLIKFFLEGIGGTYLSTNKKVKKEESDIIPIYYPNFLKRKDSPKEENNENEDNDFYMEGNFCLDMLFNENTDKEKIDIDNKEKEKEKEKILLGFKNDIIKKYEDIIFDLDKVFCLENVKLCYRILYELFKRENIITKMKNVFSDNNVDKILNIFYSLCKEYYFNIKQNLPINKLQNILKDFLKSLGKSDNFGKKWSKYLIKHIFKLMNETNKEKEKEDELDKKKDNKQSKEKEDILIKEICVQCDLLLFIFKNSNDLILEKYSINIYFEIINMILEILIKEKAQNSNIKKYIEKIIDKEFISYFLNEWMNEVYNIIVYKKQNSSKLIECFINNNKFNELMLKFIDEVIEIKNYFVQKEGNNAKIPKNKTLLVQLGFKYLDICFYIFLKERQPDLIKYWIKSNNNFFNFYSSYKMLATDNHYEEIDYKELLSFIAYISDSISCFNKQNNDNKEKNSLVKQTLTIKANEFNKIKLNSNNDLKNNINITSFSFDGLEKSNDKNYKFNKLAIFSYDKNKDYYTLLDIIDTSENSSIKLNRNYSQIFNSDEIYIVPLENISTSLYAFGSNFNHSLGIGGKLAKYYDKPSKCVGLPNNIWNIGYGNNYCLALCEDTKKIFACGCNKGGGFNSTPRATFTDNTKININKVSDSENRFINFATGNCDTTLLLNEKGELFGIGNNEEKILGSSEETKIKYPMKLDMKILQEIEEKKEESNKIKEKERIEKIKSFYIGYKNSYIIDEDGKLYGLGSNEHDQISSDDNYISYENWKNIPLPEKCTKFIDIAVGEDYIICLIEDIEGNYKLYARGKNYSNQCGITDKEKNVKQLTMCDNVDKLNFKKIFCRNNECAAITIEGDLYILNQKNQQFTLVLFDEKNSEDNIDKNINEIREENNNNNETKKIIVDDVAITKSHMLIIAREYDNEKGIYVKKLFGNGSNSKGALGLPINSNEEENFISSIREIPILDENNKKLIPIKLSIGDNKSYVLCINEEELVKNIKNNNKENIQFNINIENMKKSSEEKNILDFYYSKNADLFINIFKSITNKVLSNFIECMDEIKMDNQELIEKYYKETVFSVDFPTFYNHIMKNQKLKELSRIFIQSNISENDIKININNKPELQGIFNYLNTKAKFIASDIFKYCETNEKSEYKQFLQKAIGNNVLYLNTQLRLDKFNELFSKLKRNYGSGINVEVDRFKSNTFYDKFNGNPKDRIPDHELNQTIFGQVFQKFGHREAKDFLLKKNERLFTVVLHNEYASDSGGPYHEVISQMCQEIQSEYLNMFIKTPNNKHDIGLLRDKYIPNPDAKRKIYEDAYEFLGKLMASAIASGEALDLNLHPVVWIALLGNEITFYEYENIDYTFFSLINNLEKEDTEGKDEIVTDKNINTNQISKEDKEKFEEKYNLNFVIKNSNETDIELKPGGEKIPVTLDNLKEYISLSKKMRTSEFSTQIESIKKGFNSVIPLSICQHLYWRQLEELVCGKTKLDIKAFKENTKYDGFNKDDEVIKWFWDWLKKCGDHEQSLYLKFVSGRTRLPKDKNFYYTHVIQKINYNNGQEAFPNSATCFFTLKLPVYKDKETLEKKLNYSILNCDEIDADY